MINNLVKPNDAVRVHGEIYALNKVDDWTGRLTPLTDRGAELFVTADELSSLLQTEHAWVEAGYFGQAQAKRRSVAGHQVLTSLRDVERDLIMWKVRCCDVFLSAERNGEVKRTDKSFRKFRTEFTRRMHTAGEAETVCRKQSAGEPLPHRKTPCRRSLLRWVRLWEVHKDPLLLLKRSRYAGRNAARLGREEEQVIQACIPGYLHPNRPPQAHVVQDVHAEIRRRNALRETNGLPLLVEPSASSVRRRIAALSKFDVTAAREGLSVAKGRYGVMPESW